MQKIETDNLPTKRHVKSSLILDVKPLNFILNPDNCIPCEEYTADFMFTKEKQEDVFLLSLMDELEEFKETDDVRVLSLSLIHI